ncbi:MAG: UDP-glucose/GDP-mannose dehydrogenase family protein [Planctomycetia bacterium]|nr:UDP-glucose/GDP-mannose dehydrogenase family protein [Planctomycetia bacterium]
MNISVIGLGKLGAPLAACYAACGHRVVGVDLNAESVALVNQGQPPVIEPELERLLREAQGRLTATTDTSAAIRDTELTFVVVPTPSQPDGSFSLRYVLQACRDIGLALRDKTARHTVVITSTVMPGATGGRIRAALEQHSGKRCGPDFGLCYSPEFIALGSVVRDLSRPDLVLIGESDPRAGDVVAAAILSLCNNDPPLRRTSFASAELAKLAINTFVTAKISFANMLAELCEQLPAADVDDVTTAVGLDSRIGMKYLKAGLGYGGPCFPRDNAALTALARSLQLPAPLPTAIDRVNQRQLSRLLELVSNELPAGGTVGILGLTYKPGSPVVEQSQGFELAEQLAERGVSLVLHDPLALDAALQRLPSDVKAASSPLDCARRADVLVLCLPCTDYFELGEELARREPCKPLTLIDCWRLFADQALPADVRYIGLGKHHGQPRLPAAATIAG